MHRFRPLKYFPTGTRLSEALRDLQLIFLDSEYESSGRKPQNLSKKEWLAVNGIYYLL
jgi:Mor family transcriptional regulator